MVEEFDEQVNPVESVEPPQIVQIHTDLSARQDNMAALLASGVTGNEACRRLKVAGSTLVQWRKQAPFLARVEELRREVVDRAIGRLADLMAGKAIDKLIARLDKVNAETGETACTLDDVKCAFDLFGGLKSNTELQAKLDRLLEKLGEREKS
jgi:hypothetical protein